MKTASCTMGFYFTTRKETVFLIFLIATFFHGLLTRLVKKYLEIFAKKINHTWLQAKNLETMQALQLHQNIVFVYFLSPFKSSSALFVWYRGLVFCFQFCQEQHDSLNRPKWSKDPQNNSLRINNS